MIFFEPDCDKIAYSFPASDILLYYTIPSVLCQPFPDHLYLQKASYAFMQSANLSRLFPCFCAVSTDFCDKSSHEKSLPKSKKKWQINHKKQLICHFIVMISILSTEDQIHPNDLLMVMNAKIVTIENSVPSVMISPANS